MFNKFYIIFISLCILILNACQQKNITAKQYHFQIHTAIDTIIPYFLKVDDDMALDSFSMAKIHFNKLKEVVDCNSSFITSQKVYKDESAYLKSASDLLNFYKEYTHNEIENSVEEILKKPNDPLVKDNGRIVFIKFYEKEQLLLNEYNQASVDFINKYKIHKANSQ